MKNNKAIKAGDKIASNATVESFLNHGVHIGYYAYKEPKDIPDDEKYDDVFTGFCNTCGQSYLIDKINDLYSRLKEIELKVCKAPNIQECNLHGLNPRCSWEVKDDEVQAKTDR